MKRSLLSINVNLYTGLIALVLGISIITVPKFTIKTIVLITGLIIVIGAITTLILKFRDKNREKNTISTIQNAGLILNIAFGLVLVFIPEVFVKTAFVIIGLIVIIQGTSQLITILKLRPLTTSAKIFLILAILMLIAGVTFVFYPFTVANIVMMFVGILITFYGLVNIIISLWIREKFKNITTTLSE
jgi:uncharacterized membrane protein HdeD (DUF308 family)